MNIRRLALVAGMVALAAALAEVPAPWKNKDIGDCSQAGSATEKDGKFTLKGSGDDIWGTADGFQYLYQPLAGDGTIVAKVNSLENTNDWAKAGVMVRQTLDADSPYAVCATTPGNKCHLQYRTAKGEEAAAPETPMGDAAPYWLKLERKGDTFTASVSKDNTTWEAAGEIKVEMGKEVFIGLCLTSHDNAALSTAEFEQVAVTK